MKRRNALGRSIAPAAVVSVLRSWKPQICSVMLRKSDDVCWAQERFCLSRSLPVAATQRPQGRLDKNIHTLLLPSHARTLTAVSVLFVRGAHAELHPDASGRPSILPFPTTSPCSLVRSGWTLISQSPTGLTLNIGAASQYRQTLAPTALNHVHAGNCR